MTLKRAAECAIASLIPDRSRHVPIPRRARRVRRRFLVDGVVVAANTHARTHARTRVWRRASMGRPCGARRVTLIIKRGAFCRDVIFIDAERRRRRRASRRYYTGSSMRGREEECVGELVGWLVEGRRTMPHRGVSVGRRERRRGWFHNPAGFSASETAPSLFLLPPSLLHPVSVPSTPPPAVFRLYKADATSPRAPARDIESHPARMDLVTFIFLRKNVLGGE